MDAIVAVYDDWGIGANGTQPVALAADRKFFRSVTKGATVIVGRKTMLDFPGGRPLPNRRNIVLTRQDFQIEGVEIVHSTEEAEKLACNDEKVFVIGGGVSAAGQIILDVVQKNFVANAFPAAEETRFELAKLGNDAGIYGCAQLVCAE